MRFYTMQHTCYCGIDLHVDWMSLCVLDADGEGRVHQHMRPDPQAFREALKPFRCHAPEARHARSLAPAKASDAQTG